MTQLHESPAVDTSQRLKEIDFLRGIAIILVLFSHYWLFNTIKNGGWIGVDLFFVLSGFLVSGLLFAEYKKFGNVRPFHFLMRRGFKIYPLFYLSILITFVYLLLSTTQLNYKGVIVELLPEVFFLQNYVRLYWGHHWSLAVEEHFYVFLTVLIFLLVKCRLLQNRKLFFGLTFFIFAACLTLRFIDFWFPVNKHWDGIATHLRMDSLFAGVALGYLFHFSRPELQNFYKNHKWLLFLLTLFPLVLIFIAPSPQSLFIHTISYTLLYISFVALLIIFLFSRVGTLLPKILTRPFYLAICKIGFYSYSIYLFHLYFIEFGVGTTKLFFDAEKQEYIWNFDSVGRLVIYFIGSIALGIIMSKLIEIPFLKIRDKYFPRRLS